ncbi:MAG: 8-amino-7-oxononanoate synthase [Weeksellaceae bacterium]
MTPQPFYKIYLTVQDLPQSWDELGENIFLKTSYLIGQETALPSNMKIYYVAFFIENRLEGKCIFQRIELNSASLFKEEKKNITKRIMRILDSNMLCLGNIKLTGEHVFELSNRLEINDLVSLIKVVVQEIKGLSNEEKKPIQLLLVKDFYENKLAQAQAVFKNYHTLSVEPNMELGLRAEWLTFDDYLASLKTKYRTRAKNAFKKAEDLEFRNLNHQEIGHYQDKIYQLYLNVLNNISFSPYQLPPNYFVVMKATMQKDYQFFAGFHKGELICFYTLIHNQKTLETGFLKYDSALQQAMQLYLNMLYRMLDYGINHRFKTIIFSRSAIEIKSSIGAEPIASYGLLKHTNPILNKGLKLIFNQFYEPKNFIPRNPFKNVERVN